MNNLFGELTKIQINVLIASIMADGEITKLYPGSRRINNSYREHYGKSQEGYRYWKADLFESLLYIRPKSQCLVSKSNSLFTKLYSYFYNEAGEKRLPSELLESCTLPYFLAILFLDDGSLSISRRVNHKKQIIYLTPHIYLYLQNFLPTDLQILQEHILITFGFKFRLSKRNDGYGYVLKLTKVNESIDFLQYISQVTQDCLCMDYKFNWEKRFSLETEKLLLKYPDYVVRSSDSDRFRNYNEGEIAEIINLKENGWSDKSIAEKISRSYWSVVYKIASLRKNGCLK